MMDILDKRTAWNGPLQPVTPAVPPQTQTGVSWLVPVLCAASVIALLVILLRLVAALTAPASPQPRCTAASAWLPTIIQQEQAAQWQVAATNAQTALTTPHLCAQDRAAVAEKMVADGLEALYATAFDPRDVLSQEQEIDRYHALARHAQVFHVPFPSSLQVAQRSYQIGQFLLTKVAIEDAYRAGQVTTAEQDVLHLYSAAIYNLGYWWTVQGMDTTRTQGLHLVALSQALDSCYRLGSGTAFGMLQRLVGGDPQHWPSPAPSPLLTACLGSAPAARRHDVAHHHR